MSKNNELAKITNYIYECGILNRTPRSGMWFLGTGDQSVAEHVLRVIFVAYALTYLTPKADRNKVILMSLVHDLGEGRTSDLNYVHQKYGRLAESQAMADIAAALPFGSEMFNLYREMEDHKTLEARLTKDADQLEWIATLREEETKGNIKAHSWATIAYKRLKTPAGKKLGRLLMKTHPDSWWFDKNSEWWVNRKGVAKK